MSKKKKKRSVNRARPNQIAPKRSNKFTIIALAVGIGLVLTGGYSLYYKKESQRPYSTVAQPKKENVQLRESRKTLPPEQFRARAYVAYQTAREIPEVLDDLYCYCRCRENNGHKNLLSCYVDSHAST